MRNLSEGALLANRYKLIRQLGRGASAEVWLAHDSRVGTQVALKILSAPAGEDNTSTAKLLNREWRIGSRLMHANIVRVFEYHDDADGAFYALQYVSDTDIGVLTGADPAESMRPVALIADALRYAHGKHIYHRDIKAANVLLDNRGAPYLIDFGVAASDTDGGSIRGGGSPISSSPEQTAGEPGSAADDIYALGVLMHELLTGSPANAGQVTEQLADGHPMPASFARLLADMLNTEASVRPDAASVGERLAELGISPGAAPARFVAGQTAVEAVVETVAAPTLHRKPVAQADALTSSDSASGVSAGVILAGLGVAAVLLLLVIFVLPNLTTSSGIDDDTIAEETAADVTAAAATDGTSESGSDANSGDDAMSPAAAGRRTADTSFSENIDGVGPTSSTQIKAETDIALGDLLSQLERLRFRAIDRWGGQEFLDALDVYAEGDQAYVDKNYRLAGDRYREASRRLQPFFDRIEQVFEDSLAAAQEAFERSDFVEAIRLFDLAVSITPGNREAEAGLARANNLESVLTLMTQGEAFEENLELEAARLAFGNALELDPLWSPAATALERVRNSMTNLSFEQRMTEGFDALMAGDFDSARAAFTAAAKLDPASTQPADGLLQVDQEVRLAEIRRLETETQALEAAEQWESAVINYENILSIDADLQFAQDGLAFAKSRAALHARLGALIDKPDTLSDPVNMQSATQLLLDVTRIQPLGPRLIDHKDELSRLLKRAATELPVTLISDNMTDVAIFKVGKLGTFAQQQINLRPGQYVAVGIRPGYRDVRVEFRVAPEVEMQAIIVRCEEAI